MSQRIPFLRPLLAQWCEFKGGGKWTFQHTRTYTNVEQVSLLSLIGFLGRLSISPVTKGRKNIKRINAQNARTNGSDKVKACEPLSIYFY